MTPFYVITQDDEPWKLPKTLVELGNAGITPKVIRGVNGYLLGLRSIVPHEVHKGGEYEYMHPSGIGCVLAHLAALTCAIADGHEDFIIAEDDVVLCRDFQTCWSLVRSEIPDEVKLVLLEYLNCSEELRMINGSLLQCVNPFGTACIWWRREAAIQALRMLRPINSPYDIMLIRHVYPFGGMAVCKPALVRQLSAVGEWPSSVGCRPKTDYESIETPRIK